MSIELPLPGAGLCGIYTLGDVPDDLAAQVRTTSAPVDDAAFDDEVGT